MIYKEIEIFRWFINFLKKTVCIIILSLLIKPKSSTILNTSIAFAIVFWLKQEEIYYNQNYLEYWK
jgi:hypothetical protein